MSAPDETGRLGVEATRPTFRFTTSSAKPTFHVECQSCGWTTQGNGRNVFPRADRHVCRCAAEVLRAGAWTRCAKTVRPGERTCEKHQDVVIR